MLYLIFWAVMLSPETWFEAPFLPEDLDPEVTQ